MRVKDIGPSSDSLASNSWDLSSQASEQQSNSAELDRVATVHVISAVTQFWFKKKQPLFSPIYITVQ